MSVARINYNCSINKPRNHLHHTTVGALDAGCVTEVSVRRARDLGGGCEPAVEHALKVKGNRVEGMRAAD